MNTLESLVLLASLFLSVALVAGNNLSACVGTLIGSRVIGKWEGILIGIAGYVAGLLIQGSSMIRVSRLLFPSATPGLVTVALIATIIVFIAGNSFKVPISLSMSLVGLIIGISISRHMPIDSRYAFTVVGMWFVAPVISILIAGVSVRAISASRPRDVWRRASTYKLLLLLSSFLAAYTLGANTIGVVVSVAGFFIQNVVVAILAIPAGSYFLSRGSLQRIGSGMFSLRYSNAFATLMDSVLLVEAATLFGLPLSNTQALSSALFGAGISYRERFLSAKPFLLIVLGWAAATMISFTIGLLV